MADADLLQPGRRRGHWSGYACRGAVDALHAARDGTGAPERGGKDADAQGAGAHVPRTYSEAAELQSRGTECAALVVVAAAALGTIKLEGGGAKEIE